MPTVSSGRFVFIVLVDIVRVIDRDGRHYRRGKDCEIREQNEAQQDFKPFAQIAGGVQETVRCLGHVRLEVRERDGHNS